MEEKKFEEFNLKNEVDIKINNIKLYQELKDINKKILELNNNKKSLNNNQYLKQLNNYNHRKIQLEEKSINFMVDDNQLHKYLKNNKISILNNNKKYNSYNFNTKDNNENTTYKLLFINSIIKEFNLKNINNSLLDHIVLDDCEIKGKIKQGQYYSSSLLLSNNKHLLDKFVIRYSKKGHNGGTINIVGFEIGFIKIENLGNKKKVQFSEINISKNIKNDSIILDNLYIKTLKLTNIRYNFKNFEIRNCIIENLIIKDSNLGNTIFNGIIIEGKLEIENTTLNDCIFNGVEFKYNLKNIINKGVIDFKVMKDNYRQLKHVMDKNGNHTEANNFFALEMEYYGKTLKWDKNDFVNKLIHEFQYYTSRFGNSIIRSLISLLILIIISSVINFGIMHYCYNILIDWKLNFINLLNPFFGFNKGIYENLKEIKIIYFGFVVYKIVYAILVYQLIIALKRTTRR